MAFAWEESFRFDGLICIAKGVGIRNEQARTCDSECVW